MKIKQLLGYLIPRSLLARMLWLLLLAILLSQALLSGLWMQQLQRHELESMLSSSRHLADSAASSIAFFQSLPEKYRQLALDQLRSMGGSRFFVSINKHELKQQWIRSSSRKNQILEAVEQVLRYKLGNDLTIRVNFSTADQLHLFDEGLLLADLPPSWVQHTLLIDPVTPPVLVTQVELAPGEWLYLAAVLPPPFMTLDEGSLPPHQIRFILLLTTLLFLFTVLLVRWQTRPLRQLADAAVSLGKDINQEALPEAGASEVVAVTRAINIMQHRLRRYIDDRERLFSSISHDLKTPITRLRLRVELLEDEELITKFGKDLDDLEMMVKGALQTVKDTDIHENIAEIDLNQLLEMITEGYNLGNEERVTIEGRCKKPYRGKPLALKRCIGNLVDNAIKYGQRLRIIVMDDAETEQSAEVVILYFIDEGPGLPEALLETIFEPYYRMDHTLPGTGLGLGIARSIAHAHGGDLVLENRPQGGLQAVLSLPRH